MITPKRQMVAWRLWTDDRHPRAQRYWVALERRMHPWLRAGFAHWVSKRRMGGTEGVWRHIALSWPAFVLTMIAWAVLYGWRRKR